MLCCKSVKMKSEERCKLTSWPKMVTMGSVQIALGKIERNVNTWNPSLEYISLGSGGGMH